MGSGDYRQVGKTGDWSGAHTLVAMGGKLYTVASGDLYRIYPGDGSYEKLGGGGWKTRWLATGLAKIVTLEESGTVYVISVEDGSYDKASDDGAWAGTRAATSLRDTVITRDDQGAFWKYKPRFKTYEKLPASGTWKSRLLAATTNGLFTDYNELLAVEESGSLYAIHIGTGAYRELPGSWGSTTAMVAKGGTLYTADKSGALYAVDVETGTYGQLGTESSWKSRALAVTGDRLYTLEESGTLYEIETT
jgi:hypothetical protein